MSVTLAATEIANDSPKIESSDYFALVDPLIEDWDHAEIRASEGANSGMEVVPCAVSSDHNQVMVRVCVQSF